MPHQTILIFDDAALTAELIEDELQKAGFQTIVVTDVNQAVRGLKKKQWSFDLVIYDWWFTRITAGYEIFTLLRTLYPLTPAILFSKVRWSLNTTVTPADHRDLATRQFQEIEKAGTIIIDKIDVAEASERTMQDAITQLIIAVKTTLADGRGTK